MISEDLDIKITTVAKSKLDAAEEIELQFGKTFTDHMFVADYENGEWTNLEIKPFQNIEMSPATSFIHYGQSIFEGLKAHATDEGDILIFRPQANAARLNASARRLCMAELPEAIFINSIKSLVDLDRKWMPKGESSSLYIRPFMFGTEEFLGVKPSGRYRFMVILSPSGAYYSKPVRVKIETKYSRAMEGGVGSAKTSGNYAASLLPAREGFKAGYDQLLWTDANTHTRIEESGTMNAMFILNGKLITPKTSTSILSGITRDSILTIARDWGYDVEERDVMVSELKAGLEKGILTEAFGVGTAATIAHISEIGIDGEDYILPSVKDREFSNKMANFLNNLKRGREEDPNHWLFKV
ncbi:MAG: branched-chain amino acid aminotransferase [Salibacteraceae bacterium]|nr:branched-chain amino acid aminotransferase [Salibacteraceae bacterium]|tara:strand:+ start:25848 stop:26915 length:1068 start_codon:yes stop_codon:yes gene_type:complete